MWGTGKKGLRSYEVKEFKGYGVKGFVVGADLSVCRPKRNIGRIFLLRFTFSLLRFVHTRTPPAVSFPLQTAFRLIEILQAILIS